jgi:hypothetical protein
MQSNTTALVTGFEAVAGGRKAAEVFRDAVSGSPETKSMALAVIAKSPERALALLQFSDELGLTPRGASDALDEVVGLFKNPAQARRLMKSHLTDDRMNELLLGRGDLPSTAATLVEKEAIIRVIAADIDGTEGETERMFRIFVWAEKLKDRDDWDEILDERIGEQTIRWHLIMFIWNRAGCPKEGAEDEDAEEGDSSGDEIGFGEYADVGLDPFESHWALVAYLANDEAVRLDPAELVEVGLAHGKAREERERTPVLAPSDDKRPKGEAVAGDAASELEV